MKKLAVAANVVCIVTLISCAVGPTFIEPSFVYPNIQTGGMAILPVGASQGAPADITTRREAALAIEKALEKRYAQVRISGIQTTTVALANGDLAESYAKALDTYSMTGVTDAGILEKIGSALSVRYLVMPIIQRHQTEKVSFGTKHIVTLEAQVWDVETKKAVFQHVTEGTSSPGLKSSSAAKAAANAGKDMAKIYFPDPK